MATVGSMALLDVLNNCGMGGDADFLRERFWPWYRHSWKRKRPFRWVRRSVSERSDARLGAMAIGSGIEFHKGDRFSFTADNPAARSGATLDVFFSYRMRIGVK